METVSPEHWAHVSNVLFALRRGGLLALRGADFINASMSMAVLEAQVAQHVKKPEPTPTPKPEEPAKA